jgi:hypothetical protein
VTLLGRSEVHVRRFLGLLLLASAARALGAGARIVSVSANRLP